MRKDVVILIKQHRTMSVDQIAEELRSMGLDTTGVFDYGVITGSLEESLVPMIQEHMEVQQVDFDKTIQIAPPDQDIQ